jgi:hypothetical protein
MKGFHLLLAAALTLGSIATPITSASAAPSSAPGQNGSNAGLLAYCESLITSGDYSDALTFGRCMGFNETSDEGFATQTCMALRGEGLLAEFGFASFDDCVTTLHQENEGA